jgi:osmotically-inducible protein OsmY
MKWRHLIPLLALAVSTSFYGCKKAEETTGTTPGGGPPGPAGAYSNRPEGAPGQPGGAGTIGQPAANAALKAKVKNALITTKGLDSAHMDVEAAPDGTVTLTGSVHSEAEKKLAEKQAKAVAGVTKVNNTLTVSAGH